MPYSWKALPALAALALLAAACSSSTNNSGANNVPPANSAAPTQAQAAATSGSSVSTAGATTAAVAPKTNFPPPVPADKQVTINFADYNEATAGIGKDATDLLINEFEAKFPNIKVTIQGITSDQIIAKVQAEVIAGDPPDLAQEGFGDLDFVANSLKAKPVDSIVPPDELAQYEAGLHPNGLKLAQLNGHLVGVPFVFSTPTLFYNADLFRQAGLDPDKPPQTWADVKTDALQIKDKTGKGGLNIACLGAFDWCFQGIVDSDGGAVISADRTKLQFNDPNTLDAISMWQDLVKSGAHPPLQANDAYAAFSGGNLGMYLQTSAVQSALLAGAQGKWELRASGMPSFAGKPVHPTNSGSALFILTGDPLKQRAAWELMKYLTSERGYTVITSQIGYLPLRTAIVNDPQYLKPWADTHPLIQANLKQLDALVPWVAYPGINYVQIKDILMTAIENVIYNGADLQKTMLDAQTRATALMPK